MKTNVFKFIIHSVISYSLLAQGSLNVDVSTEENWSFGNLTKTKEEVEAEKSLNIYSSTHYNDGNPIPASSLEAAPMAGSYNLQSLTSGSGDDTISYNEIKREGDVFFNIEQGVSDCVPAYSLDNSPFDNLMKGFTKLTCSSFNNASEIGDFCRCVKDNVKDDSIKNEKAYKEYAEKLRKTYIYEHINHVVMSYVQVSEKSAFALAQSEQARESVFLGDNKLFNDTTKMCTPGNLSSILKDINSDESCFSKDEEAEMKKYAMKLYADPQRQVFPLKRSHKNTGDANLMLNNFGEDMLGSIGKYVDAKLMGSFDQGIKFGGNQHFQDVLLGKTGEINLVNIEPGYVVRNRNVLLEYALKNQEDLSEEEQKQSMAAMFILAKLDPFIRDIVASDSRVLNEAEGMRKINFEIMRDELKKYGKNKKSSKLSSTTRSRNRNLNVRPSDIARYIDEDVTKYAINAQSSCKRNIEELKKVCKEPLSNVLSRFNSPRKIRNVTNTMLYGNKEGSEIPDDDFIRAQNMSGFHLCKAHIDMMDDDKKSRSIASQEEESRPYALTETDISSLGASQIQTESQALQSSATQIDTVVPGTGVDASAGTSPSPSASDISSSGSDVATEPSGLTSSAVVDTGAAGSSSAFDTQKQLEGKVGNNGSQILNTDYNPSSVNPMGTMPMMDNMFSGPTTFSNYIAEEQNNDTSKEPSNEPGDQEADVVGSELRAQDTKISQQLEAQNTKIKELEAKLAQAVEDLEQAKLGDKVPPSIFNLSNELDEEVKQLEQLRDKKKEVAQKIEDQEKREQREEQSKVAGNEPTETRKRDDSSKAGESTSSSSGTSQSASSNGTKLSNSPSTVRTGAGNLTASEVERNDALLTLYSEPSYDSLANEYASGEQAIVRYVLQNGKRVPYMYRPKMKDGQVIRNASNQIEFLMIPLSPEAGNQIVAGPKPSTDIERAPASEDQVEDDESSYRLKDLESGLQ